MNDTLDKEQQENLLSDQSGIDTDNYGHNNPLPQTPTTPVQQPGADQINTSRRSLRSLPPLFSIEEFTARRRGKRPEDSKLPRRIQRFYEKQDELITCFEQVHLLHAQKSVDSHDATNTENYSDSQEELKVKIKLRRVHFLTNLSLFINVCLFIAKIVAAYLSASLSVISSVVDSAVDLVSGIILSLAARAIQRRDPFNYPQGRTRLEPISIVALAVFMCATSLEVILESTQTTIKDMKCIIDFRGNQTDCMHSIHMGPQSISIMGSTILLKFILFVICSRESSATLNALSQDHRNDVFSNIVALVCGFIGSRAKHYRDLPFWLVLIDPFGAICISTFVLVTWMRQAFQQVKRLSGHTATPEFIQQITWVVFHHSPLILKIDTVRAFHFGTHFLVEVDIVLPEEMSLKEAHDIGEELQKKIERVPEVERAFVHLDYEFTHKASDEHKVV